MESVPPSVMETPFVAVEKWSFAFPFAPHQTSFSAGPEYVRIVSGDSSEISFGAFMIYQNAEACPA